MGKIIEITVSRTGETSIQTKGFVGSECKEASRHLESVLGLRLSERPTSELYATSANTQVVRQ